MPQITDAGRKLDLADVFRFERELEAALPDQYSAFLLESNGGIPDPALVDIPGLRGSPTDVQVLFGLGRNEESSDLRWNRETFSDRLPSRLLPIACDSGGNLFCISLSGADTGSVQFVDLEQPGLATYFVANSFRDFISSLRN